MIPTSIDDAPIYADYLIDISRPGTAAMIRILMTMDNVCHMFMYDCGESNMYGTRYACEQCKIYYILSRLMELGEHHGEEST